MPRLLWPSWRWMTISSTPSWAISTAWACLSWCGAKRRRTPAAGAPQLGACRGGRPVPSARRAVDDAQQRTDRQLTPHVEPEQELFPAPGVHADFAATPALAAPNQQRAATVIKIAFGERKGFLDAQPGAPHDHDESAEAPAVRPVPGGAHDGDDLFDLRRVGRVAQTLVAGSVAGVECRQVAGDQR